MKVYTQLSFIDDIWYETIIGAKLGVLFSRLITDSTEFGSDFYWFRTLYQRQLVLYRYLAWNPAFYGGLIELLLHLFHAFPAIRLFLLLTVCIILKLNVPESPRFCSRFTSTLKCPVFFQF